MLIVQLTRIQSGTMRRLQFIVNGFALFLYIAAKGFHIVLQTIFVASIISNDFRYANATK